MKLLNTNFIKSYSKSGICHHMLFNKKYLNEIFTIDGITYYPDNNVQIFNRWGILVYEINGYNNADKSFNGKSEGRITFDVNSNLPEGTYYYVIKYTKPRSGIRIEKTGYLYLTY